MLNVGTDSADISVYNGSCKTCEVMTPYVFHPWRSSTFGCYVQNNKRCAPLGEDVFTMGGAVVQDQVFEMDEEYMPIFFKDGGYMGLNLGSNFYKYPSPLSNLIKQMDAPIFTIYMNGQIANEKQNGLLTLGAVDASNCQAGEAIKYAPLSANNNWQVKLQKFVVGSYSMSVPDDVQIDTREYEIKLPQAVFNNIVRQTGAKPAPNNNAYYVVDCSTRETLPPLVFTIGGNNFTIESKYYTTAPVKELLYQCGLAIFPFSCEGCPTWVFGSAFLTPYCGIFDAGQLRMGFAPAKQT